MIILIYEIMYHIIGIHHGIELAGRAWLVSDNLTTTTGTSISLRNTVARVISSLQLTAKWHNIMM
jgi:hypothetical protein